jgi:hypothetical protein
MSTAPPASPPALRQETHPVPGPRSEEQVTRDADREAAAIDDDLDAGAPRPLADPALLEDKTPDWFKTTSRFPLGVLAVGLVYVFFAFLPLAHTDVWGHLAYGRWIVAAGALPAAEPLMPLSKGMPFVDTAWLSQLIGYFTATTLGYAGLKFLNGLGVALAGGLLLGWIAHRTRSLGWGVLALATFLVVGWEHLTVFRPQLAGLVLFSGLLVALHASPRRWQRFAVPVGFVLWANVHGSWVLGLGLLGAFVVGRAADVLLRTGRPGRLLRDRRLVQACVLWELAAVATLVNPYGLGLHVAVLSFSSNPNLAALVEWQPLSVAYLQGRAAFVVAAALFLVHRFSPRRASTAELLLLIGLGGAAVWTSRLIVWWGVVAAWSLSLHAAAVWGRRRGTVGVAAVRERRGLWTVVGLGVVWILFAISPLGFELLHAGDAEAQGNVQGVDRLAGTLPVEKVVERATPVGVTRWLRANPPRGLVFNTYEWGDYLLWAGPEGLEVFVNSHVHAVPAEVWQHYLHVAGAGEDWEEILARYGVNTVAVDKAVRGPLIERLAANEAWERVYDDGVGSVFVRREPIFAAE